MNTVLRRLCALFLLVPALAACDAPRPAGGEPAPTAEETRYATPPELTQAVRNADGSVILSGLAPAQALVRLNAPDGQAIEAAAGADGAWSTTLPPAAAPRMFAFSAEAEGRVIRAEGPVLVLPAPGPPAVAPRAGFGALAVGLAEAPVIVAVDYDGGGGAAVAGLAPPNSSVRLLIDGVQAGSGQADARGRFAIMAAAGPTPPGEHAIEVATEAAAARVRAALAPPVAPGAAAYTARREAGRWRIDWALPGGGTQATLVFDAAAASKTAP